jgi:hypothetical protein
LIDHIGTENTTSVWMTSNAEARPTNIVNLKVT